MLDPYQGGVRRPWCLTLVVDLETFLVFEFLLDDNEEPLLLAFSPE